MRMRMRMRMRVLTTKAHRIGQLAGKYAFLAALFLFFFSKNFCLNPVFRDSFFEALLEKDSYAHFIFILRLSFSLFRLVWRARVVGRTQKKTPSSSSSRWALRRALRRRSNPHRPHPKRKNLPVILMGKRRWHHHHHHHRRRRQKRRLR